MRLIARSPGLRAADGFASKAFGSSHTVGVPFYLTLLVDLLVSGLSIPRAIAFTTPEAFVEE